MDATQTQYPDLDGQVAVVTGGSRGVGAGIAQGLAAQGVRVVVNGRDEAAIDAVVGSIVADGGAAVGISADLTDPDAVQGLRAQAEAAYGPVAMLCAIAGGEGRPSPIVDLSLEQWNSTLATNLTATFLALKTFLPGMINRRRGAVVTMSSTAGRMTSPASPAYGAAKAGVLMLTRQAASQVAEHDVRVNAIALGAVLEGKPVPPEMRDQIAALHPLRRTGLPGDVAALAAFLVSSASAWITGATVDLSGGRVML